MPKYLELRRYEIEVEQDRFYYELDFDQKKDVLDKIIRDEVDSFYIRELGFKKAEDIYLNEEEQLKIISKITAIVYVKRMTPAVLANVAFYYRYNDEKELQKIIADKVSIAILDLTLRTNVTTINL